MTDPTYPTVPALLDENRVLRLYAAEKAGISLNATIAVSGLAAAVRGLLNEPHSPACASAARAAMARAANLVCYPEGDEQPRPYSEWRESDGPVLWFTMPVEEKPWCGTPDEDDWPWEITPRDEMFWVRLPALFREGGAS